MKKAEAISILATSVRPREAKDRARYDEAVRMAIEALKCSETPKSSERTVETAQNVKDEDLISKLSEIRSEYNCFDEDGEPQYRALSEAIRILSQLADGDTISRRAAIDAITDELMPSTPLSAVIRVKNRLKELLPAQPERKKGTWIPFDIPWYRCSECGAERENTVFMEYFCPNCGADMRGEQDGRDD